VQENEKIQSERMANICSTYIQIYFKERISVQSEEFQFHKVIRNLLSNYRGYSYCTPLFTLFGPYGRYLEVVYGEKWGPSSIHAFFKEHKTKIDAIFCRYYDDGGDYDHIQYFSNNELLNSNLVHINQENRIAEYGFDEIKFKSKGGLVHVNIEQLSEDWYSTKLKGKYFSESNFSSLLNRTSFNEIKFDDYNKALLEIERNINSENNNLFSLIENNSEIMEYYYKGKLVTYAIGVDEYSKKGFENRNTWIIEKSKIKWMIFPFDSWYNCIDEIYLKYKNEINPAPNKG